MITRDQIPVFVKKCFFLSDALRDQILNNYKTLSENSFKKFVWLLEDGYEKQEKILEKSRKEEVVSKTEHQKEVSMKLRQDEKISKQSDAMELAAIEDELNALF